MIHPNSTFNHPVENWVYADCVARMAQTGLVTADIGKLAYQSDTTTYYRLLTTAPTWDQVQAIANGQLSTSGPYPNGTRTVIPGSVIRLGQFKAGAVFRWRFNLTKNAAGAATSTLDIAVGSTGTTADTARVSFTKPAGQASADEGVIQVDATVRNVGASGVISSEFMLLAADTAGTGGHLPAGRRVFVANTISSAFDNSANNLYVGLCLTVGVAESTTISQILSECFGAG